MTIGLLMNRSSHLEKITIRRKRTRLASPEVWAAVTSKVCRDSGRASFAPLHSRRQKKALLVGCSLNLLKLSNAGKFFFYSWKTPRILYYVYSMKEALDEACEIYEIFIQISALI